MAAGAPALPAPALLREAFLWSETRTVTKTATVSLHGNDYEVDAALAGRKVELIFDPFDLTRIEVRYEHRAFGLAVPVRIARHTHPKTRGEIDPAAARRPGLITSACSPPSVTLSSPAAGSTTPASPTTATSDNNQQEDGQ